MNKIEKIIRDLNAGNIDTFTALSSAVAKAGSEDAEFIRLDHERDRRCGFPEFIYGAGKSVDQILQIIPKLVEKDVPVLITRLDQATGQILAEKFPIGKYDSVARLFVIQTSKTTKRRGQVLIVAAGTSDAGVALEAKYTVELCGCGTKLICDVGVAGIHRLFAEADQLSAADVLIVVAGMEGALPSVIGGLVKCPVIAVPTSIGYGTALNGFTALFGMLSSCASGIVVVNIDNGFGAGCAATRIINAMNLATTPQ